MAKQSPFAPQVIPTERGGLQDVISSLLGQGVGQKKAGGEPFNLGDYLQQALSLPSYTGQLTAPQTPLQANAGAAAQSGLDALPGYADLGKTVTSGLASIGSSPDYSGILKSLDTARQASLGTNLRDVTERFSSSGLRDSTDLARSLGETANASDQAFLGQAATLLPQLAGQRLSALQSLPGAADLFATLPGQVAGQAATIGGQQQATNQADLTNKYQEFMRTALGLFAPILNFASGAPTITGPGKGTQALQGIGPIAAAATA